MDLVCWVDFLTLTKLSPTKQIKKGVCVCVCVSAYVFLLCVSSTRTSNQILLYSLNVKAIHSLPIYLKSMIKTRMEHCLQMNSMHYSQSVTRHQNGIKQIVLKLCIQMKKDGLLCKDFFPCGRK